MTAKKNSLEDGFWCNTDYLDKIRKEVEHPTAAISLYLTLNCLATDEGKPIFRATNAYLASQAGMGLGHAIHAMAALQAIGLIAVDRDTNAPGIGARITLLGEVRV